ncbi:hypothetical protein PMAYCL1PPCAC_26407 [Pristionchus mayeri]|uniref:Uncharacterized protein n=1 Tax=Pristionchus mayeri TaxID=1317129 RepID=A0AAN5D5R7_9BILA|nr:hypothetical protein PMAYCL1PPCAC_26407 [Pristionchus mayeri]
MFIFSLSLLLSLKAVFFPIRTHLFSSKNMDNSVSSTTSSYKSVRPAARRAADAIAVSAAFSDGSSTPPPRKKPMTTKCHAQMKAREKEATAVAVSSSSTPFLMQQTASVPSPPSSNEEMPPPSPPSSTSRDPPSSSGATRGSGSECPPSTPSSSPQDHPSIPHAAAGHGSALKTSSSSASSESGNRTSDAASLHSRPDAIPQPASNNTAHSTSSSSTSDAPSLRRPHRTATPLPVFDNEYANLGYVIKMAAMSQPGFSGDYNGAAAGDEEEHEKRREKKRSYGKDKQKETKKARSNNEESTERQSLTDGFRVLMKTELEKEKSEREAGDEDLKKMCDANFEYLTQIDTTAHEALNDGKSTLNKLLIYMDEATKEQKKAYERIAKLEDQWKSEENMRKKFEKRANALEECLQKMKESERSRARNNHDQVRDQIQETVRGFGEVFSSNDERLNRVMELLRLHHTSLRHLSAKSAKGVGILKFGPKIVQPDVSKELAEAMREFAEILDPVTTTDMRRKDALERDKVMGKLEDALVATLTDPPCSSSHQPIQLRGRSNSMMSIVWDDGRRMTRSRSRQISARSSMANSVLTSRAASPETLDRDVEATLAGARNRLSTGQAPISNARTARELKKLEVDMTYPRWDEE